MNRDLTSASAISSNVGSSRSVVRTVSERVLPCPGVTFRVAVLSLFLAALFGYVSPYIDFKLNDTFLGGTHLPPGAIAVLLILILVVNPLLRLLSTSLAFTRNEVLTVYISCLFSCLVPGHGAENFAMPNMVASFYFASSSNKYLSYLTYFKPWLTPAYGPHGVYNRAVVDSFYLGLNPGQALPWAMWLLPLFFWICLSLVSYLMLGCLSVILRAQWSENEALAFPLLKLPLEMTDGMDQAGPTRVSAPPFFRNPLMWIGFAIAVFIEMLNGLNVYFPDVPAFPMSLNVYAFTSDPPWNQLQWINLTIWLMAIGVAYLLTAEVAFSLWFFYFFIKAQLIASYYLGFPPNTLPDASGAYGSKVFVGFQVGGCTYAYVFMVLWLARQHIGHVAGRAFGRVKARESEAEEMLSYPVAFWGFVFSFGLMVGATCVSGVRLDVALALWLSYLVYAIALTRVVVEGGMLFIETDANTIGSLAELFGPRGNSWLNLGSGAAPTAIFQNSFTQYRGFLLPSFVQGLKLAYDQKINCRRLGTLLMGVILIATLISWPRILSICYHSGALQIGHQWWAVSGSQSLGLVNQLNGKTDNSLALNWLWFCFGALLTFGMMFARSRLPWFPLHPLGYVTCLAYPIQEFWCPIFMGWLCKFLINKFGGADSVRRTRPLFLGLILGDVAMILFWLAIDCWQGRSGHFLMPG